MSSVYTFAIDIVATESSVHALQFHTRREIPLHAVKSEYLGALKMHLVFEL